MAVPLPGQGRGLKAPMVTYVKAGQTGTPVLDATLSHLQPTPIRPMSFAAFRQSRQGAMARKVALVYLGMCSSVLCKAAILHDWPGFAIVSLILFGLCLPALAVIADRPNLLLAARITGQCLYVLAMLPIILNWYPSVPAVTDAISDRLELLLEVAVSLQNQISLAWAAVVYASICCTQFMIYTQHLHGCPWVGAARWLLNFLVLMVVQCGYEARSWALYCKYCVQQQLAEQQQRRAPEGKAPEPAVAVGANSKQVCHATVDQDSCTQDVAIPRLREAPQVSQVEFMESRVQAPVSKVDTGVSKVATGSGSLGHRVSESKAAAALLCEPLLRCIPPNASALLLAPGNSHPPVCSASPDNPDTMQCGVTPGTGRKVQPHSCPHGPPLPPVLRQAVAVARRRGLLAYRRNLQNGQHLVNMKLNGLELEQLPTDFAMVFQDTLKPCMPGVTLAGVALRSGCVMLTLDLLSHFSGCDKGAPARMAGQCVDVLNEVLRQSGLHEAVGDESTLQVQTLGEVLASTWDTTAHQFSPTPAHPTMSALHPLLQRATHCYLVLTSPAVQCAPAAPAGKLLLSLHLQLPGIAMLRSSTQAMTPGSATEDIPLSAAGSAAPQQQQQGGVAAKVLVRHQGGEYLSVSVSLTRQEAAGKLVDYTYAVQAEVSVAPDVAQGLSVELWVEVPGRAEVLCEQAPVLLLPPGHQVAQAEVLSATTQEGDSGELLADLVRWVNHTTGLSVVPNKDAVLSQAMEDLGTGLLLWAVRSGREALMDWLVAVMKSSGQQQGSVPGVLAAPAVWLVHAAHGEGHEGAGGALHAAMATGDVGVLERVLRWGQLYGGRRWQWPWYLTDQSAGTALHLAAAHREPGVCESLIQSVTRTQPPKEVQTARDVWLTVRSNTGRTPAEVYQRLHDPADQEGLWEPRTDVSADCRSAGEGTAAVAVTGHSAREAGEQVVQGAEPRAAAAAVVTWRSTLTELVLWVPSAQYRNWKDLYVTGMVVLWAWTLVGVALVHLIRGLVQGSLGREWVVAGVLHNLTYVAIILSSTGLARLGSWQAWMRALPYLQGVGHAYVSSLPLEQARTWAGRGHSGVGCVYVAVLVSAMEQNPLLYTLVSRAFLAYCHSLAFATVGYPHPLRRAVVVHAVCVAVNSGLRAVQLRAFHQWRLAQAQRAVAARAATGLRLGTGAKAVEEGGPGAGESEPQVKQKVA